MSDNPFKNLGLEFMNWRSAPSIGPLIGLMMGGNAEKPEENKSSALGTGVAPPSVPGGIGINPAKSSQIGFAPNQFQLPNLTLPAIGTTAQQSTNIDADGDGQVDNFWGIKK